MPAEGHGAILASKEVWVVDEDEFWRREEFELSSPTLPF